MKRRTGFTLVELLVVIGIIALLISILLPSLNKARKKAEVVACASLMRQIAIAARAYAAENKDSLPPVNMDLGSPYYDAYVGTTANPLSGSPTTTPAQNSAWVRSGWPYWRNASIPAGYKETVGSNIGRLVLTNFLKGDFDKMTNCPSGGQGETNGSQYQFNVHFVYRDNVQGGGGSLFVQPWWKKLSKYGRVSGGSYDAINSNTGAAVSNYTFGSRRLALACDPVQSPSTGNPLGAATHISGSTKYYNLMYPDGSVLTAATKAARPNGMNNFNRINEFIGYLEDAVDGSTGASNVNNIVWGSNSKWAIIIKNP